MRTRVAGKTNKSEVISKLIETGAKPAEVQAKLAELGIKSVCRWFTPYEARCGLVLGNVPICS
jgi:hypothetical protein